MNASYLFSIFENKYFMFSEINKFLTYKTLKHNFMLLAEIIIVIIFNHAVKKLCFRNPIGNTSHMYLLYFVGNQIFLLHTGFRFNIVINFIL